jgi:hypothetical protein
LLSDSDAVPVIREADDDEVADGRIAQETSSEDEGYEDIDSDDQTEQQREDEGNAYATDERGNNIEKSTSFEIESALRVADQSQISKPSDLAREVRKRNEFNGERIDGLDAVVIFLSESTGSRRSRQYFKCSNSDCEIHVSFTIQTNIVKFMEAEFDHNHRLSEVKPKRDPC